MTIATPSRAASSAQGRPKAPGSAVNIVVVVLDDMSYDLMSCAGHPYIQTPTIDRLASEGVSFQRAYCTAPLCGPSRASLLTGQLPTVHGNLNNTLAIRDPSGPRLPDYLHALGYATGFFGKLHVGVTGSPPRFSWDRHVLVKGIITSDIPNWAQLPEWEKDFWRYERLYVANRYNLDGKNTEIRTYQTDYLFEQLLAFIEGVQSKQADPFFALVTPLAVHNPYTPARRHESRYLGMGIPGRPKRDFDLTVSLTGYTPQREAFIRRGCERQAETLLAVDDGLRSLLDCLDRLDLTSHTVVVFTSDNGYHWGDHLVMWKGHPWEESVRVPLICWGPGVIPGDRKSCALFSLADLLPTVVDLAGGRAPQEIYGVSQLDVLLGLAESRRSTCMVEFYREGESGVGLEWEVLHSGDHKLVHRLGQPLELYDIKRDPYEQTDLSSTLPRTRDALNAQLKQERAQLLRKP